METGSAPASVQAASSRGSKIRDERADGDYLFFSSFLKLTRT